MGTFEAACMGSSIICIPWGKALQGGLKIHREKIRQVGRDKWKENISGCQYMEVSASGSFSATVCQVQVWRCACGNEEQSHPIPPPSLCS